MTKVTWLTCLCALASGVGCAGEVTEVSGDESPLWEDYLVLDAPPADIELDLEEDPVWGLDPGDQHFATLYSELTPDVIWSGGDPGAAGVEDCGDQFDSGAGLLTRVRLSNRNALDYRASSHVCQRLRRSDAQPASGEIEVIHFDYGRRGDVSETAIEDGFLPIGLEALPQEEASSCGVCRS